MRCWIFPGNENSEGLEEASESDDGIWHYNRGVWKDEEPPTERQPESKSLRGA